MFFAIGIFCSLNATADYQSGLDAYQQRDYERALTLWLAVANSRRGEVDPNIQSETFYALGMLYWVGQGVRQDTVISAQWLEQAAELHHPGAQTKLGFLYSVGQGVPQSDFESQKWFRMAANQGYADAQYNLGIIYREGYGVPPDGAEALRWFREAASNGDVESAHIVAQHEAGVTEGLNTDSRPSAPLDESWILSQDPEHYTIQVIAVRDRGKLLDFVNKYPDWVPWAIYQQSLKDQPLWVLVQGDYTDLDLARQAVKNFPTDIQKRDKVWIRRFVMIQALMQ